MRCAVVGLFSSLSLMLSAPSIASECAGRFAVILASSVGFPDLEGCDQAPEMRKTDPLTVLFSNSLAGADSAAMVMRSYFTGGAAIPYVELNTDPCDAFLSSGGGVCSTTPGQPPSPFFGTGTSNTLNEVLTDEQEALLGCGPFYGTDCELDGIDLTNAEASVLLQSFPDGSASGVLLPGARGPTTPGYDPSVDGSAPVLRSGPMFESEMAALSWNLLMTLVAFSRAPDGAPPADAQFDPLDPTRTGAGQCSFVQPQYCSSVIAFFAPEPGATLATLGAMLSLACLRTRRSS